MKTTCQRSCGTGGCAIESAESCPVQLSVAGCPWNPQNPPPIDLPSAHASASATDSLGLGPHAAQQGTG